MRSILGSLARRRVGAKIHLPLIDRSFFPSVLRVSFDPDFTHVRQAIQYVATTFADWVSGGPEPVTSGRNNLHTLAILDAIIESGNSGRPLRVGV